MIVLIVDDQPEIREGSRSLVSALGHTALTAEDAAAALELALEYLPDMALVDIQMPGVDGYATAKMLREEFGAAIWICALTGSPVDMPTAAQSGFDGVMAKPLSDKSVHACISEARHVLKRTDPAEREAAPATTAARQT